MLSSVLVIGGPTASGKSGLALDIAQRKNGVVINADSMQLYDGLPILTAQPAAADKSAAPHALYGVLDPEDTCSAGRWRTMVLAEIEKTLADKKLPIVVGGTGFYLKALLEGMSPIPEVPAEFRGAAIARQQELGNPAFHEELKKRDPATAGKLDPLNTQRNVRAWEVLEATGRGLAAWHEAPPVGPPAHLSFKTVTLLPPRDVLNRQGDLRFDAMLRNGAIDEALDFRARMKGGASALDKALGYAELLALLDGDMNAEDAAEKARLVTRSYAKRQTTWFRNQIRADIALQTPAADKILEALN